MKKLFTLLLIALLYRPALSQTWVSISDNDYVSFDMPDQPGYKDTLRQQFYYYVPDTLLGLTANIVTSAEMVDNALFTAALDEQDGDTLRAMLSMMLAMSGYELSSISDSDYNGIHGVEAGFYAANPYDSSYDTIIFLRVFYYNRNFICFTAASYVSDIDRLSATKEQFFASARIK